MKHFWRNFHWAWQKGIWLRKWGIILVGLVGLYGCVVSKAQSGSNKKAKNQQQPVPVVVATAIQKNVPLTVQATGIVQAFSTVAVKSQIAGQLRGVYFREGQQVNKGQLLFQIDSRLQQAALMQAEANHNKAIATVKQAEANLAKAIAQVNQAKANLAKDQAQLKNAEKQAQRYSTLYAQGAVSKEQQDQYITAADAQKATVEADRQAIANAIAAVEAAKADLNSSKAARDAAQADVDNAKIQLSYSSIYSPITGRTGSLQINQGNLIKENDTTPLVTISQIRPIYVNFSLPQRFLPQLNKYMAKGKLEVDAFIPNDEGPPEKGEVAFIDSGVNTATGTIQLKGNFANSDGRLLPGQFVKVVLKLAEQPKAIVVPTPAVQTGQQGQFVYVLNSDQTVDIRPVVVGVAVGNETVIEQGLNPGEKIVTDGQFNLRPKAKVQVKQKVDAQKTTTDKQQPLEL